MKKAFMVLLVCLITSYAILGGMHSACLLCFVLISNIKAEKWESCGRYLHLSGIKFPRSHHDYSRPYMRKVYVAFFFLKSNRLSMYVPRKVYLMRI